MNKPGKALGSTVGLAIAIYAGASSLAYAQLSKDSLGTETVLSGVDVLSTNGEREIQRLEETFGEPTRRYSDDKRNGERHYRWERKAASLEVTTMTDMSIRFSRIIQVEVWGTDADGKIGKTGAGLSLGDNPATARRIYPFSLKDRSSFDQTSRFLPSYSSAFMQAGEYAPALEIRFTHDKIVYMRLTNPCPFVCY